MDGRIITFLNYHNLSSLKECFEDFDFETFKCLEPHHLQTLVKDTRLQITLEIKLKALKQNEEFFETILQPSGNAVTVPATSHERETPTVASIDAPETTENQKHTSDEDYDDEDVETTSKTQEHRITATSTVVSIAIQALVNAIKAIDDLDVEIIQRKYQSLEHIDASDRRRLSQCIIRFQLKNSESKMLTRQTFENTAKAIVSIFPKEKESIYFIPSTGRIAAKGRLYQAYKTYRDLLSSAGMILKRHRSANNKIEGSDLPVDSDEADVTDECEISGLESIDYLKTHTDPDDNLQLHWSNSRKERFRLVKEVSVSEYYQTFPILTMDDGFSWLDLDFQYSFPNAKNGIDRWKEILPKLLLYVSHKSKTNPVLRTVIKTYDQSDYAQMLLSFRVLPLILRNPTKRGKQPKPAKRDNKLEVSDGFIAYFNTEADDTRTNCEFIDIKVIGPKSNYLTHIFIEEAEYVFEDLLSAIDCAFKLHYVFNLKFSTSSKHIWDFINLVIYDIDSKGCQATNFEVYSDIENCTV